MKLATINSSYAQTKKLTLDMAQRAQGVAA